MRVGITTVILALGLVVMLLVIPVVSPSTSANAKIVNYVSEVPVGTVTIVDAPVITVVENTRAYQAVCVGSILITLTVDDADFSAIMVVTDLVNGESTELEYTFFKSGDVYTTDVFMEQTYVKTFITDYDLFEPGTNKQILSTRGSPSIEIIAPNAIWPGDPGGGGVYYWDGIEFTHAGTYVKYAHPSISKYNILPGLNQQLTGIKTIHYHIDNSASTTIATFAPGLAGAVIGAYVSGPTGSAVGFVVGTVLGLISSEIFKDETGCIWFWYGKSYELKYFPLSPPPSIFYVPKYFRISSYTLWDDAGAGNPY